MSYQPEERYWTDYLRIALPVVGLLLMLGLFWFWAASLIGDDDDDNTPAATVVAENQPTAVPTTPTATNSEQTQPAGENATEPPAEDATEPAADDDGQTDNNSGDNADEETPAADETDNGGNDGNSEEPDCDPGLCEGDLVTVNTDDLNLRAEASTEAESVATLNTGDQLEVTGPAEEAEDRTWLPVAGTINDQEVEGYVAAEFVDPEEQ